MQSLAKTVGFILLAAAIGHASDKEYRPATLNDLQLIHSATGYVRAGEIYCLSVSVGDVSYLLQYGPMWAYSYSPSELIVGDTLQVRVKGNAMYVKKTKGGEMKTEVTRRERISEGKPPLTCALPVTPR